MLLNPFVFLLVGMGLRKWKPDVQGKGFMHRVLEHPFAEKNKAWYFVVYNGIQQDEGKESL